MKSISGILFPVAVSALAIAGAFGFESSPVSINESVASWGYAETCDTVIYPQNAYKLRRIGDFDKVDIQDSLSGKYDFADDTVPHLTARDTLKAPDSLRLTDPFRYRFYVALLDSLTHSQVKDSLKASIKSYRQASDTLHARQDSAILHKLDSIYFRDSTIRAKAEFEAWYNALSKEERKKYDYEKMVQRKMHEMDSLKAVKEEAQAKKDSIRETTPRILETFALPDSMQYKRIIAWSVDPDFQKMKPYVPDTSYNYYFNDYDFLRKDLNASWLGVAGSPVQSYNYFRRSNDSGTDFFAPNEPWTYSVKTLPNYNTKTPYTELAYWGTLIGTRSKESDNIHIFTTQNILPQLNISLLYDRWGGAGMLNREDTKNKTFSLWSNWLGKKYSARGGYLQNRVIRKENGGVVDPKWLRDTSVDTRDIPVKLQNAESETVMKTFFLEQQLRIPFNFINRIKALKDSSFKFDTDSLDRNITTAFVGHSSEWTRYSRTYKDAISSQTEMDFFRNQAGEYQYFYDQRNSADSLFMGRLDNKIFLKLQPWSSEGVVSKLNVGLGDCLKTYYLQDPTTNKSGTAVKENSVYLYAGAEGQIKKFVQWDAKGRYYIAGADRNDFTLEANAGLNFYPFRKAKGSPISLLAHAETSLRTADFYRRQLNSNHYSWNNDFGKISTTKIEGRLDIPYWKMDASVGYALIGNGIYYDTLGVVRQNAAPVSVLSASVRKDFSIANILHLDHRLLFQLSSDQQVLPLPKLALNLRYYFQFVVARDEATHSHDVLTMQIGVNGFYNTKWYAPAWNPNIGVFHNQNRYEYTNGPQIDAFINAQWKRACIFIKFENFNNGWPLKRNDSFTADGFIRTPSTLKLGLFWPFYMDAVPNRAVN